MSPERTRPIRSVLDVLRTRIDPDAFDVVVLALEAVVADLGYGDVRPLHGTLAWVDRLREAGKATAVTFGGDNAQAALALAGVQERFDVVESHRPLPAVLEAVDAEPGRAIVVDVAPSGIEAARAAGAYLALALARGPATPEQLRRAGADAVVADLQELIDAS